MYRSKALSKHTWEDFEGMFQKHKGVRGGCWCTYHQLPSSEYNKMSREDRKEYHRKRVEEGIATGLILYEDRTPVGWCQFGKADIFEQLNRNRAYNKLDKDHEATPDWRITCIFVDKEYRGRGLSSLILSRTLEMIETLGGGMVEAFPFDLEDSHKPNYNGSVSMFQQAGFEKVARLGKNIQLMRKNIK